MVEDIQSMSSRPGSRFVHMCVGCGDEESSAVAFDLNLWRIGILAALWSILQNVLSQFDQYVSRVPISDSVLACLRGVACKRAAGTHEKVCPAAIFAKKVKAVCPEDLSVRLAGICARCLPSNGVPPRFQGPTINT